MENNIEFETDEKTKKSNGFLKFVRNLFILSAVVILLYYGWETGAIKWWEKETDVSTQTGLIDDGSISGTIIYNPDRSLTAEEVAQLPYEEQGYFETAIIDKSDISKISKNITEQIHNKFFGSVRCGVCWHYHQELEPYGLNHELNYKGVPETLGLDNFEHIVSIIRFYNILENENVFEASLIQVEDSTKAEFLADLIKNNIDVHSWIMITDEPISLSEIEHSIHVELYDNFIYVIATNKEEIRENAVNSFLNAVN